jgi:HSP20 family molecular chaperone IbpA
MAIGRCCLAAPAEISERNLNMNTETTATKAPGEALNKAERTRSGSHYRPQVDIVEGADELTVFADMPGLSSDQIDIDFERGTLQIFGHVPPRQPEDAKYQRREYGVGDFYRSFQVSEERNRRQPDQRRLLPGCAHVASAEVERCQASQDCRAGEVKPTVWLSGGIPTAKLGVFFTSQFQLCPGRRVRP